MSARVAAPLVLTLIGLACACSGAPGAPPGGRAVATAAPVVAQVEAPPALRLPEGVRPTAGALELTIDPRKETFAGRASFDLTLSAATSTIWLHAVDLEITATSVTVGGAPVAAGAAPVGEDLLAVRLERAAGPGEARIVLDYRGKIDATRSQGIYRQAEGEDWYAYTLFEPLQARRAFPCFDEPGFKIPWRITLHVSKGEVALANSPVEKEEDEAGGMKKVVFATSKPMPSYLVALVVGPFDVVEAGKVGKAGTEGTALRFVLPRGRRGELGYASEVTPRIVGLLEEYTGIPYPYEKLDVVIVPRYWGTMEHPGLVAMGQGLALIRPGEATTWRKQAYASIAAHELAHIWFGDYVTMQWWDDTWLNEALATWMDRKITDRLEPSWLFGLKRLGRIDGAMASDSLPSARRVREPVTSRHDIVAAFDGDITYVKGAAVLGMIEGWVGEDRMRGAIQAYLGRHAWKSTSAGDLLAALSEQATPASAQALRTFLDQPGVPIVSVKLRCAAGRAPSVGLSQRRFLSAGAQGTAPERWEVPVCLRYPAGTVEGRTCATLAGASLEVPLPGASGCPAWIVANAGATGYYRVKYEEKLLGALLGLGAKGLSPAERLGLTLDLAALARSGDEGMGGQMGALLGRLPALLEKAEWPLVLQTAEIAASVRRHLVAAELRPNHARFLRRLYGARARSLGWKARAREGGEAERLRPILVPLAAISGEDEQLAGEARRLALQHLEGKPTVAPDLIDDVLRTAARRGDRALFDRILAAARAERGHRERARLLRALGAFRAPELARAALDLLLDKDFDPRESTAIAWGLLGDEDTAQMAYDFLKASFEAVAARRTSEEAGYLLGAGAVFCDEAHRADVAASFGERAKKVDGGPQVLARALEEIGACVAHREAQQASVAAFLKTQ